MKSIRLNSPAKLNVGLRIVGRRADGYHELESVFWPITLGDDITLVENDVIQVNAVWDQSAPFSSERLPQGPENLVFKILEAAAARGVPCYRADISKRIPVGGGLGGGSSNAGTVLRFLSERYPHLRTEAPAIALKTGADTPFFLNPVPSWVTGIGETIAPLSLDKVSPAHFLVVCFPKPTSTQQIFEALRNTPGGPPRKRFETSGGFDFQKWMQVAKNDLESFAVKSYPLIGEVLSQLRATKPDYAALSGSGSTCFAWFSRRDACAAAAKELEGFFRQVGCRSVEAATFNL